MNIHSPAPMTVDEFLRWSEQQESGRYELEGGMVLRKAPQNADHAVTKALVFNALVAAVGRSGLAYYAMPDGMTVRLPGQRAYEPDALVAALPRVAGSSLEVPNPVAVFEVLSPTPASVRRDLTTKLAGYALLPSIQHYVIIDPSERVVFRFRRVGDQLVAAEELTEGTLSLDPPGLDIPIAEMLIPKAAA
ncbi:MAG: Uma2 family endonuclease [Hyphomicrobiaceae bacterium]